MRIRTAIAAAALATAATLGAAGTALADDHDDYNGHNGHNEAEFSGNAPSHESADWGNGNWNSVAAFGDLVQD
ncbi:hypothetical protein AB0C93_36305 [Streptomyces sp. NPDC048518]|uniref:hypothetical protein n=1 Tax=Streptomyces sp. NPDC048518 TaxID=3155029 RepID=UPI0033D27AB3